MKQRKRPAFTSYETRIIKEAEPQEFMQRFYFEEYQKNSKIIQRLQVALSKNKIQYNVKRNRYRYLEQIEKSRNVQNVQDSDDWFHPHAPSE